jgi:hypothetical protein
MFDVVAVLDWYRRSWVAVAVRAASGSGHCGDLGPQSALSLAGGWASISAAVRPHVVVVQVVLALVSLRASTVRHCP